MKMAKKEAFSLLRNKPTPAASESVEKQKKVVEAVVEYSEQLKQHTIFTTDTTWHLIHGWVKHRERELAKNFSLEDAFADFAAMIAEKGVVPWTDGLKKKK